MLDLDSTEYPEVVIAYGFKIYDFVPRSSILVAGRAIVILSALAD
jgi:hypothetical protein